MFKDLELLLDDCSLNMTISKKDDLLTVTIIPRVKDKTSKNLISTPLVINGTAEDLDKTIGGMIAETMAEVMPTLNNIQEFKAAAKEKEEKAKADKEEKAKQTQSNKATATAVVKKDDAFDPKKLSKNDKSHYDKAFDLVAKIKAAKDPDMVDFLKKGLYKELDLVTEHKENILAHFNKQIDAIKPTTTTDTASEAKEADGLFAQPGTDVPAKEEPKKAVATKKAPATKAVELKAETPVVDEPAPEETTDDEPPVEDSDDASDHAEAAAPNVEEEFY